MDQNFKQKHPPQVVEAYHYVHKSAIGNQSIGVIKFKFLLQAQPHVGGTTLWDVAKTVAGNLACKVLEKFSGPMDAQLQ